MTDLTELRRLLEEGTPRPWHLDSDGDSGIYTEPRPSRTSSDVATADLDADERLIVAAVNALPDLLDALERVKALHRPYSIYGECDCPEEKDESTHVEVEEVGRTCNELYVICVECCTAGSGYQSEDCAYAHTHTLTGPYCNTLRAIDGEVRS